MSETPHRIIALDAGQTNIVLGALYARKVELKHHLSFYSDVERGPEPTDLCCRDHRTRLERRAQERAALQTSEREIVELIGSFEAESTDPAVVDLARITLRYRDENGTEHDQPLSDLPEAGLLIDPETGDDLELVSARVAHAEPRGHRWVNSLPREIATVMLDREDSRSVQAAQWLAEHESDDLVWEVLGKAVDRLTDIANDDE